MPPRAKTATRKAAETGKRYPLNMRTTFETRQMIEAEAKRSGRSLAQVAESSIERAFHAVKAVQDDIFGPAGSKEFALTTAIFANLRPAGVRQNEDWTRDPALYQQAIIAVLETMVTHAPNSDEMTGQDIMLLIESVKGRVASRLRNRGNMG